MCVHVTCACTTCTCMYMYMHMYMYMYMYIYHSSLWYAGRARKRRKGCDLRPADHTCEESGRAIYRTSRQPSAC